MSPANEHLSPIGETNPSALTRNAFRVIAILLGATFVVDIFYFYLAFQLGAWQMFALASAVLAFGVTLLISLGLIWRGRDRLGVGLMLGAILLIFPVASFLIAGIGLVFGVSVVVLVTSIATQLLLRKWVGRAIIASVAVGAATVLLDVFGPDVLGLTYRLAVPELQTFIRTITGIVSLIYAFFIIRHFVNYTRRTKLLLAFLVVALIPLSLLAYLNDRANRAALTDLANQALFAAASQTAASLDIFVGTNLDAVRTEAQLPDVVEYLSLPAEERVGSEVEVRVTDLLQVLSRRSRAYVSSYALLDSRGVDVVDTQTLDEGVDKSDRDSFRVPLQTGQPYVSPIVFSPSTGQAAIYFASPVRTEAGEIVGVLRVRYNAAILRQLVAQSNGLAGKDSFAVVFDEHHLHLAHGTAPETVFRFVGSQDQSLVEKLQAARRLPNMLPTNLFLDLPDLEQNLTQAVEQPFFAATDVATGSKVNQVAVTTMQTQPWLVAFFQPREVFLAAAEVQTRTTLLLAVLTAGVVAAAAVGVSQLLANPIVRLTAVATQIAAGDLTAKARLDVGEGDEVGTLATVFNTMTDRLRDVIDTLEERVAARTKQVETLVGLGRQLSAILDLSGLMREVVTVTKETFDYYHVHIYLLDEQGETLIMTEGYGEAGAEMKRQGHRIPLLAPQSLVARAARDGRVITVPNVHDDPHWLPNPLLPDTQSEMAVPVMLGREVVGVLDVQSEKAGGLNTDDETTLQALANQIAVAVRNAFIFSETQDALYQAQKLQRLYTSDAWEEFRADRPTTAYEFHRPGVPSLEEVAAPEIVAALQAEQTVDFRLPIADFGAEGTDGGQARSDAAKSKIRNALATPLKIHDEIIGVLGLQDENPNRRWTKDEITLIETVSEQMSLAMENARLLEKERQTAVELRTTDRLKSEFLTTISHELRTPLNSIIGFSEVLLEGLDGDLSQEALADVTAIHTSGQHLLALINDILDLAKIEAGRMELVRKPVSVNRIMGTIRATSASLVKDKPVKLIIPEFDDLPLINVDDTRMHQIILNLVSNAVKFTEEGHVAIDARQEDDKIIISVEDTGVGIQEESLDAIFERFRQIDGATTRKFGGTGLGLTITRYLVEMHGGEIWVESQEGVGSTFFFSIPLEEHLEQVGEQANAEETHQAELNNENGL